MEGEPDVKILQATVTSLTKEVIELKKDVKSQSDANRNIIIGAVFALILTVAIVAVEVIIFHTRAEKIESSSENLQAQELLQSE